MEPNRICRRLTSLFFVIGLVLFSHSALAGDTISGLWEETSNPHHKSSVVVISQDGPDLYVACYWEFEGQSVVWHGKGTRKGKQVTYEILHTRCPKAFDRRGSHHLTLSADGKTMTGKWKNSRGESGPLTFKRKK